MDKTYTLNLFADYFQIVIRDASLNVTEIEAGADWWTEEDHKNMLSIKEEGRLLVMGTFRNFPVPVEVLVAQSNPAILLLDDWDQIVECSLLAKTGTVLIQELWDENNKGLLLKENNQYWRVRLYYGGFDTIDSMGIEGQDHYQIELWPTDSIYNLEIIKLRDTYQPPTSPHFSPQT